MSSRAEPVGGPDGPVGGVGGGPASWRRWAGQAARPSLHGKRARRTDRPIQEHPPREPRPHHRAFARHSRAQPRPVVPPGGRAGGGWGQLARPGGAVCGRAGATGLGLWRVAPSPGVALGGGEVGTSSRSGQLAAPWGGREKATHIHIYIPVHLPEHILGGGRGGRLGPASWRQGRVLCGEAAGPASWRGAGNAQVPVLRVRGPVCKAQFVWENGPTHGPPHTKPPPWESRSRHRTFAHHFRAQLRPVVLCGR